MDTARATVREQLTRQGRRSPSRFGDSTDVVVQRTHRRIFEQPLRGAVDHGQDVVEVVCDAAGEPAHQLHLLGLKKLRLQPAGLREVDGNRHEERDLAVRRADRRDKMFRHERRPVLPSIDGFPLPAFSSRQAGGDIARNHVAAVLRPQQHGRILAHEFIEGIARKPAERRVRPLDSSAGVGDADRLCGGVERGGLPVRQRVDPRALEPLECDRHGVGDRDAEGFLVARPPARPITVVETHDAADGAIAIDRRSDHRAGVFGPPPCIHQLAQTGSSGAIDLWDDFTVADRAQVPRHAG